MIGNLLVIVFILLSLVVLWIAWSFYLSHLENEGYKIKERYEREKEIQDQKALAEERERTNKNVLIFINKCFPKIESNENIYVIDNNIWLDGKWWLFFRELEKYLVDNNIKITMLGKQYDEFSKLKNEKSGGAKKIMLRYIDKNILKIEGIDAKAQQNSYFDEFLIKYAVESKLKELAIVTKDRELIIRISAVLRNAGKIDILKVIDAYEIEQMICSYYDPEAWSKVRPNERSIGSYGI